MKNSLQLLLFSLFILIFATSCRDKFEDLNLDVYQYRDTKNLVKFVYDNARLLEQNGTAQIDFFKANRSRYCHDGYYLYIYRMDGKNVFHSGMPQLEGKDLSQIADINGKNIFALILKALQNKHNPHAWVHFTWYKPGTFFPISKSSCHFKVTTADGENFFVGGGLDYPHEEKEFIRIVVDTATDLLQKEGLSALDIISAPQNEFNFREVKTFAFNMNGKILISPIIGNNLITFNLIEARDEIGHQPFRSALKNLATRDSVWEVFMAKNRFERLPEKKCFYLRKIKVDNQTIIVGAITNLPRPPWSS